MKVRLFSDMLNDIRDLITAGDDAEACHLLNRAVMRIDGLARPQDMLTGPAIDSLHSMLLEVMIDLGC